MDVVCERFCGRDIHKHTVVACLVMPGPTGTPSKEVRRFGTMTNELLRLADWLLTAGGTHVAMESTGVSWKPIWNLVEDQFALLLVNARHVKVVPGRKTDVKDGEWLVDLLRHGLLRSSFVPERPHREVRELPRYRTSLVHERSAEVNRLQTTREGANITLGDGATNILGLSSSQMLATLAGGETDAAVLAHLARGRLRDTLPVLERALAGQVGPHQRCVLAWQLAHIDFLDAAIAEGRAETAARLRPFADAVERLATIAGIDRRTAEVRIADIGTNMIRFPTPTPVARWAGMCPGNDESAGKRQGGKTRKGSPWLRSALYRSSTCSGS